VSVSRTARALAAGALLSLAPGIGARAQTPFVPPIPQPALDAAGVDHALDPPPTPPRTGARIVTLTGLALTTTGLVGSAVSPRCTTRVASGDCVDVRGAHPVYPVAVVVGIALSIAGHWAMRQDAPHE
jgi:hypothetical protein